MDKAQVQVAERHPVPALDELYYKIPGLFLRREVGFVIDLDGDYRFADGGKLSDGCQLVAIFRRESVSEEVGS